MIRSLRCWIGAVAVQQQHTNTAHEGFDRWRFGRAELCAAVNGRASALLTTLAQHTTLFVHILTDELGGLRTRSNRQGF